MLGIASPHGKTNKQHKFLLTPLRIHSIQISKRKTNNAGEYVGKIYPNMLLVGR